MHLAHPYFLMLLPVVLLWLRRPRGLEFCLLPREADGKPSLRRRLLWLAPVLGATATCLAIVAAAGPLVRARRVPDRRFARDIVLAIDTSESMRGRDFELDGAPASRMEAVLHFAGRFIAGRRGDRVGIVAFGSRAVTQCPLTFDRDVARTLLAYVEPEMLGKRTALGEGIALGVARLPEGGALVLLSDGRNTAGRTAPTEAARAAAARGVRIYSLGVGSAGPVPIPARLPSGRMRMQMKNYPLEEETLRQAAEITGGAFLRAADAGALRAVFERIDELEKKPAEAYRRVKTDAWGSVAGLLAGALLGGLMVASSVFLRTAPQLI